VIEDTESGEKREKTPALAAAFNAVRRTLTNEKQVRATTTIKDESGKRKTVINTGCDLVSIEYLQDAESGEITEKSTAYFSNARAFRAECIEQDAAHNVSIESAESRTDISALFDYLKEKHPTQYPALVAVFRGLFAGLTLSEIAANSGFSLSKCKQAAADLKTYYAAYMKAARAADFSQYCAARTADDISGRGINERMREKQITAESPEIITICGHKMSAAALNAEISAYFAARARHEQKNHFRKACPEYGHIIIGENHLATPAALAVLRAPKAAAPALHRKHAHRPATPTTPAAITVTRGEIERAAHNATEKAARLAALPAALVRLSDTARAEMRAYKKAAALASEYTYKPAADAARRDAEKHKARALAAFHESRRA
jgi:hypothetical protein